MPTHGDAHLRLQTVDEARVEAREHVPLAVALQGAIEGALIGCAP